MRSVKWDRRYLDLVDYVAAWSKDRSTHIGAVLVRDNRVIALGFNGIPAGVEDEADERNDRPGKYLFFEHAERNVVYTAAKNGLSTRGATLYTTGIPCADCARGVIQSGISSVIVWKRGSGLESTDRWYDSIKAGGAMLKEAGVVIVEVER